MNSHDKLARIIAAIDLVDAAVPNQISGIKTILIETCGPDSAYPIAYQEAVRSMALKAVECMQAWDVVLKQGRPMPTGILS